MSPQIRLVKFANLIETRGVQCAMSAPTTTDDAAQPSTNVFNFDAQVLKRMSGVQEKSQLLSQAERRTAPS